MASNLPLEPDGRGSYLDANLAGVGVYYYKVNEHGGSLSTAVEVQCALLTTVQGQASSTLAPHAGQSFDGVVATFGNVFPTVDPAMLTATIDWGDGTTSTGAITANSNGAGFTVAGSNTYAAPGVYTVYVFDPRRSGRQSRGVWHGHGRRQRADRGDGRQRHAFDRWHDRGFKRAGADAAGEEDLAYTWSTIGTPPAPVTFSDNGDNVASETTATFAAAGSYELNVTIENSDGQGVTSDVTVDVTQIATSVSVSAEDGTPDPITLANGATKQFVATELDQFGNPMTEQPTFTWSTSAPIRPVPLPNYYYGYYDNNPGPITSDGMYTVANTFLGNAQVTASANYGVTGSATVNIPPVAPSLTVDASSALVNLTVTGAIGDAFDIADIECPVHPRRNFHHSRRTRLL